GPEAQLADPDLLDRQELPELGDRGEAIVSPGGDVAEEQHDARTERRVAGGPMSQVGELVPDDVGGEAGGSVAEFAVIHGVRTGGSVSRGGPDAFDRDRRGPASPEGRVVLLFVLLQDARHVSPVVGHW